MAPCPLAPWPAEPAPRSPGAPPLPTPRPAQAQAPLPPTVPSQLLLGPREHPWLRGRAGWPVPGSTPRRAAPPSPSSSSEPQTRSACPSPSLLAHHQRGMLPAHPSAHADSQVWVRLPGLPSPSQSALPTPAGVTPKSRTWRRKPHRDTLQGPPPTFSPATRLPQAPRAPATPSSTPACSRALRLGCSMPHV